MLTIFDYFRIFVFSYFRIFVCVEVDVHVLWYMLHSCVVVCFSNIIRHLRDDHVNTEGHRGSMYLCVFMCSINLSTNNIGSYFVSSYLLALISNVMLTDGIFFSTSTTIQHIKLKMRHLETSTSSNHNKLYIFLPLIRFVLEHF